MENINKENMKKLNVEEYKNLLKELLIKFHKLCQENNLKYSLAYGTLLGAVRHKGYIPWDDDIDVMMPREDYNKLLSIKKSIETNDYYLLDCNDKRYNLLFAKFVDKNTFLKFENEDRYNDDIGLFIDIFPIDYLGNTEDEVVKLYNKTKIKKLLLISAQWKRFFKNKLYGFKRNIIRFLFFVLSRFVSSKKLVIKIEQQIPKNKTNYAGCLSAVSTSKPIYKSEIFSEYIELEFEKYKFSCIKNFDAFLTIRYGNYMELPPVEKRFGHHFFDVYLKDNL